MAAINVSPESFYKGSVAGTTEQVDASVERAITEGADIIDIGGASTAPYLKGGVSTEVEVARVRSALARGSRGCWRARSKKGEGPHLGRHGPWVRGRRGAQERGIDNQRRIRVEERPADGHDSQGQGSVAPGDGLAPSSRVSTGAPIEAVGRSLSGTLAIAREAGLDERRIVLDPGIGFFRDGPPTTTSSVQRVMPWYEWDCDPSSPTCGRLRWLGRPLE